MAYDAAKASVLRQLLQQGLSKDQAIKIAGISESDLVYYLTNDVPLDSSITTSTGTVNSGGSTTIVYSPPVATDISEKYATEADGYNNQIQSINKQLGSPDFGGDPNLTADQRTALEEKRTELYAQYNQAKDNQYAAEKPGPSDIVTSPNTTTAETTVTTANASANDPVSAAEDATVAAEENAASGATVPAAFVEDFPQEVDPAVDPGIKYNSTYYAPNGDTIYSTEAGSTTVFSPATAGIMAGVNNAQAQAARANQAGITNTNTDWRVKISLAQGADYLYKTPGNPDNPNDPGPGILQPLANTNGVIFPYTPKIDISYKAKYSEYDLTHSNYRGYFYQNSAPGEMSITGLFTAQTTNDANYLLAVIHFFRSATKMFYGQDAQRGSPPPLVFLSGLGQYQFNNHPCLITNFNYSLPDDVDYIRALVSNQNNTNTTAQNTVKQFVATNTSQVIATRLANAGITAGALPSVPFGSPSMPALGSGPPTYVPTKMTITVTLLPVNTRKQVSTQFSLKGFANGNLLRGGFW